MCRTSVWRVEACTTRGTLFASIPRGSSSGHRIQPRAAAPRTSFGPNEIVPLGHLLPGARRAKPGKAPAGRSTPLHAAPRHTGHRACRAGLTGLAGLAGLAGRERAPRGGRWRGERWSGAGTYRSPCRAVERHAVAVGRAHKSERSGASRDSAVLVCLCVSVRVCLCPIVVAASVTVLVMSYLPAVQ